MDAASIRKEQKFHIFLAAALVACLILSFWPILRELLKVWKNDDNSYCFLVVPLFLYLCWEKRRTFDFFRFSWNALGAVAVAASGLIIIAGQLGGVVTLYFIGIWASIASIAYLAYGKRVTQLVFPFIILLFIVPFPPYINNVLTFQLKLAASALATLMLRLSGISVFLDGNIIDLGVTQLQVVEACSGLRYLMPLILLALLIGYFFTKGLWRRGVLVLLVVPLSVFFNALRIWLSGILTLKGHPELVENFFHDFSGWVIFMIAGAVLFGVTRLINMVGARGIESSKLKSNILATDARRQAQTRERAIFPDDAVREKPSAASQIEDLGSDNVNTEADADREMQQKVQNTKLKSNILATDARRQAQTRERAIFPDDAVREEPSAASQIEEIDSDNVTDIPDGKTPVTRNSQLASRSPQTQNTKYQTRNTKPKTPFLGLARPVVLTVITCLLLVSSGYALKKIPSATNLPERQSFQSFPTRIGQWEGRHSTIPQKILDQLWADDYVEAAFSNSHSRNTIHLLIPFYEWQGTRHNIHAPQACLLGGGWSLTRTQEKTLAVEPGRKIPVMIMMLEKGDAKILGSYFFFQRGRVFTNPWMNKVYLMWDAFTKRRTDGALVRAELLMTPGQSVEDAWEKLEGFIAELWPILPKYVPE